ncbi:MAG: hypothetical protein ACP5IY_06850 [Halothiobacillaceae bacterium]
MATILADAGYLSFANSAGMPQCGVFSQVRLTAKGLAQLMKTPQAIAAPDNSIGERLSGWARDAASQAGAETLAALVRLVLG